jgi:hypothetical protein
MLRCAHISLLLLPFAAFAGEPPNLYDKVAAKQTITRASADSYVLTNEERGTDGRWRTVDTYRYTGK